MEAKKSGGSKAFFAFSFSPAENRPVTVNQNWAFPAMSHSDPWSARMTPPLYWRDSPPKKFSQCFYPAPHLRLLILRGIWRISGGFQASFETCVLQG